MRLPRTTSCAPVSASGLRSTGFMAVSGSRRAARACRAWARPISPPSAVTAALLDMFCGLKGTTRVPRLAKARQSPATISDLPTSLPVPMNMSARAMALFLKGALLRRYVDNVCIRPHHAAHDSAHRRERFAAGVGDREQRGARAAGGVVEFMAEQIGRAHV